MPEKGPKSLRERDILVRDILVRDILLRDILVKNIEKGKTEKRTFSFRPLITKREGHFAN